MTQKIKINKKHDIAANYLRKKFIGQSWITWERKKKVTWERKKKKRYKWLFWLNY